MPFRLSEAISLQMRLSHRLSQPAEPRRPPPTYAGVTRFRRRPDDRIVRETASLWEQAAQSLSRAAERND